MIGGFANSNKVASAIEPTLPAALMQDIGKSLNTTSLDHIYKAIYGDRGPGFYYRGRGPGGPGTDYYGWPDDPRNSRTQFPPPPYQAGGQPYKML